MPTKTAPKNARIVRPVKATGKAIPKPAPPKQATRSATKPATQKAGPLTIEAVRVTADIARQWLDRNASNRSIRKRQVLSHKRDMLSDNWRDVGDPLRFDTNGDFCDGQHRMLALIAADEQERGIAFTFVVIRGVAVEDRIVIDTGTRRSAGDQLRIAGYSNYMLLASTAKWAMLYERRVMYAEASLRTVTHAEILEYVEQHPHIHETTAITASRLKNNVHMPAGYISTAYYLCSQIDSDQADEFFARLGDGVGLPAGDPILALRNRVNDLAAQRANLNGNTWLSLVFRAWNARRDGRTLRALPVYRNNNETIPAPELK